MKPEISELEQKFLDTGICGSSIPLSEPLLELAKEFLAEIKETEKEAIDKGYLTPFSER